MDLKNEKENVKAWLKQIKKDRFWLADQCGVHKRTVDSWFFKKSEIPAKALLTIYDLMADQGYFSSKTNPIVNKSDMISLKVKLDNDLYQIIQAEAKRHDLDINTFCSDFIISYL
ncbi:MAG: hypothetical protein LUE13_06225 [Akkermansiaceae bacterium]|nr:hypothetical protein [Akkermansiaceae bacterium]